MGQQRERQIELSPQHFERFGERIDFCGMREIKESRGFLTRNAQCAGNIGGLNLKRPRPFNKAGLSLRKKRQHGFAFTRMRPLADGDGFRTLKQQTGERRQRLFGGFRAGLRRRVRSEVRRGELREHDVPTCLTTFNAVAEANGNLHGQEKYKNDSEQHAGRASELFAHAGHAPSVVDYLYRFWYSPARQDATPKR